MNLRFQASGKRKSYPTFELGAVTPEGDESNGFWWSNGVRRCVTPLIVAMFSCSIYWRPAADRWRRPRERQSVGRWDRLIPRFDVARQRHVVPGSCIPIIQRASIHIRSGRGGSCRLKPGGGDRDGAKRQDTAEAAGQNDVLSLAASWYNCTAARYRRPSTTPSLFANACGFGGPARRHAARCSGDRLRAPLAGSVKTS
jgi:hypothetical protein